MLPLKRWSGRRESNPRMSLCVALLTFGEVSTRGGRHPTCATGFSVALSGVENLAHAFARHVVLLTDCFIAHFRRPLKSDDFSVTRDVTSPGAGTGFAT